MTLSIALIALGIFICSTLGLGFMLRLSYRTFKNELDRQKLDFEKSTAYYLGEINQRTDRYESLRTDYNVMVSKNHDMQNHLRELYATNIGRFFTEATGKELVINNSLVNSIISEGLTHYTYPSTYGVNGLKMSKTKTPIPSTVVMTYIYMKTVDGETRKEVYYIEVYHNGDVILLQDMEPLFKSKNTEGAVKAVHTLLQHADPFYYRTYVCPQQPA